jgi:antitoxin (DNA-binding transcriptional repressor) of toxin-antitoxin stability system
MIIEHGRPVAMLVPLPVAGDLVANQLVREGKLTPAGDPAGVAALLAITPHPAANGIDSADVVSELREDRL